MTDKLDTAVSNVIGATNDNKNLLNPSLGQQDKADPLDIAVNPDSIKADRTIAALAAITGTPLKPITVQGAAIKDMVTGDYKPDSALDAIRHFLYRKDKPK